MYDIMENLKFTGKRIATLKRMRGRRTPSQLLNAGDSFWRVDG